MYCCATKMLCVFLSAVILLAQSSQQNQPQPYLWKLMRFEGTSAVDVVQTKTGPAGGNITFFVTTCQVVPVQGCRSGTAPAVFYMCPRRTVSTCNDPSHYFCPSWGCETIAPSWLEEKGGRDPNIKVHWWPDTCHPPGTPYKGPIGAPIKLCSTVMINVINPSDSKWDQEMMWGLRYLEDGIDRGGYFTIQRFKMQG